MTMKTINVTQDDIDKSRDDDNGSCCGCPIWHATRRIKELCEFDVGTEQLYNNHRFCELPPEARKFSLAAWEKQWDKLKPISFEVTLPGTL